MPFILLDSVRPSPHAVLRRWGQEDHKFKVGLEYITRYEWGKGRLGKTSPREKYVSLEEKESAR